MYKLLIVFVLTTYLLACGGGENDTYDTSINNTKPVLDGTWIISCHYIGDFELNTLYAVTTITYLNNRFMTIRNVFSDNLCTTSYSNRDLQGSFTIEDKISTLKGVIAYDINSNITQVDGKDVDYLRYNIVKIDPMVLYFGALSNAQNGKTPALRPNTLNFTQPLNRLKK